MHLCITLIAIVAFIAFAKHRRDRTGLAYQPETSRGDAGDSAALVREISALNGRIAVLERIITENRSSQTLAHEIDALRDR